MVTIAIVAALIGSLITNKSTTILTKSVSVSVMSNLATTELITSMPTTELVTKGKWLLLVFPSSNRRKIFLLCQV